MVSVLSSGKMFPFLTASMSMFFLFALRYIPSAKECPLLLQLPNGEISKTNGFISPVSYHAFILSSYLQFFWNFLMLLSLTNDMMKMWGGVIVWNPQGCLKDSESQHPIRQTISRQVRCFFQSCLYVFCIYHLKTDFWI